MTLQDTIAQAIANAFWETAESPRHWHSMGENQREVFRICAHRAIEAGRAYRQSRTPQVEREGSREG